jgi:hypothetical protein
MAEKSVVNILSWLVSLKDMNYSTVERRRFEKTQTEP